jgi:23S rRNA pseudouridine1911/1915/1917 synthase
MVVAKNDLAHRALVAQFQERDVWKEYLAVVWGNLAKPHGRIETPIGRNPKNRQKMAVQVPGAKPAVTDYEVVERFADCSVAKVVIHTGRTHQIRVHFASLGHPIVGDAMYGRKRDVSWISKVKRQMLHSHRLEFAHPRTGKVIEVTAPLPADIKELLTTLRLDHHPGKRSAMIRSTARTSSSLNPFRT